MNFDAFYPQGNTVLVAASSSTAVAATQISTGSVAGVFLSNPCTIPLYVGIGSSSVAAGQPTTAAPCPGLCLPPGTDRPLSIPTAITNCWISAVTSAGTAAPGLFATPGMGV